MCGIAGAVGGDPGRAAGVLEAVRRMTAEQTHRGPDDEGWLERGAVVFGHNRLSIIDLSACGHQPMANETGTVQVVFNGEIYNHRELRSLLLARGHHFTSDSDTEVLVHGYEEWGIEALLGKLRGMFAFALHDAPADRVVLARDRFGIKPLYYAERPDGQVVFASEVRALARSGLVPTDEDPEAWLGYLLFGSVPAPRTTLKAVRALPAGHYLTADDRGVRVARYYDLAALFAERKGRGDRPPAEYTARLRAVLEEAVDIHLLSDAPLGVFLSGGIDSSALVALAALKKQELRTVGIVFEEAQFSEEPFQRVVAERYHTDHHSILVTAKEFREDVARFLESMDQPTVDGLNTYFVARAARQAGLKAVLAGIGGDEIFAGYGTLARASALGRLQGLPGVLKGPAIALASTQPGLRRLRYLSRRGAVPLYLTLRGMFTPREAAELLGVEEREAWAAIAALEPERAPRHPVLRQQFMETRHYMGDQLLKDGDVFGMAHSLEIRVPFLDHVLAETALDTPLAWRFDKRWPKPLLSKTLADLLPPEVVFRRKQGFTFPIGPWLRSWDAASTLAGAGLSRAATDAVWREFREGRVHWSRPWALLVLSRGRGA